LPLFDFRGRQKSGWNNKLIWGDNKLILSSRYEKWKDIAAISGPPGLRLIKGLHEEVLSGAWQGYRSSRLGLQWRVIYRVIPEKLLFQVASITAHDYRRS